MSLDVYLLENYCAHCQRGEEIHSQNITHNLNTMAEEAGIYKHLWRPEEIGIKQARELIEPLQRAIGLMMADPPRFEKLNPENGWGTYKDFIPWLKKYLEACEKYPESWIRVSR